MNPKTKPGIFFCCLLMIVMGSCGGKNRLTDLKPVFKSAEDTTVIFFGNLQCNSNKVLRTVLRIGTDTTWQADIVCEGSRDESMVLKGKFRVRNGVLTLLTDDISDLPLEYTLSGDSLIPAGMENMSLRQYNNELIEIDWNLAELNGKAIPSNSNGERKPHFRLSLINGRISGHGGCNGFSGYYEIAGQNKIRISGIISTKMACIGIEYESDFFNALHSTDNYKIESQFLIFRKGDQTLAKFLPGK